MTLHDDNPVCVAQMICFMYWGDYPCSRHTYSFGYPHITLDRVLKAVYRGDNEQDIGGLFEPEMNPATEAAVHLDQYLMADKYDCPNLRDLAARRAFCTLSKPDGKAAMWSIVDFVKEANVDTKWLKEIICTHLASNLRHYVDDERFGQFIKGQPDFALLLFKKLASKDTVPVLRKRQL